MDNRFLKIISGLIIAVSIGYSAAYFNYFETPTADYIGNIRDRVLEYRAGDFPGSNYKFLPAYPLVLLFVSSFVRPDVHDHIYFCAMIINIMLLVPYLLLVFLIYRRFLSGWGLPAAMLFLGVNIYTVYTAVNSELEMLLSLMVVLSMYLTMKDSRLAYIPAFIASVTKWDSVFVIPAVMFRDFFYRKKRIAALLLGAAASAGLCAWLVLSVIKTAGYANPYVGEIAKRGPNLYRYPADCFLIASGYVQWMAMQAYYMDWSLLKAALFSVAAISILAVTSFVIWGGALLFKRNKKEFAPIFIFFAGFVLIHLVYQNTKERYVLPILWILVLFMFYGLKEGFIPFVSGIKKKIGPITEKTAVIAFIFLSISLFLLSVFLLKDSPVPAVAASVLFIAASTALVIAETGRKKTAAAVLVSLIAASMINLNVSYGVMMMDHYSLRNVEFKKVALWYRDNASTADRMLVTEINMPKYYTGFGDEKFLSAYFISSMDYSGLLRELGDKSVTYVFVDDFYIRRYRINDKNAIDKKAWLFMEIRDRGEADGRFKLIKTFDTKGGIKSYLFRFLP
jgi:hypothetical protein